MSAKNILSNEERLELIAKYEADKLNSPPANIKDETLIKNYGTDEQKARVQQASATEAPQASAEQTTTTDAGSANQQGEENLNNIPSASPNTAAAPAPNGDYVAEYGRYTELFGKMPSQDLTAEQLRAANDKKAIDLENDKAIAAQIKANQKAQTVNQSLSQNVTLQHRDTKEKIIVSKYTYDRFMTQMTEWTLAPEAPAEVAGLDASGLDGEIKPPKESIGGGK